VYRRCKTLNVTEGARLANQKSLLHTARQAPQTVCSTYLFTYSINARIEAKKAHKIRKIAFAVTSSTFFVAKG